ncbi:serine/threonine protein phosphatase [Nocardia sp. NBC_00508]|uniref:PP2C family protein-serine/threonine phosphatase n=1 Tax=Nocardia sp. NBC_00508 TaxID=2975992 RepID=UPI002E809450|nr:serine/threonine protein phosphatase [Nocardia sp. NBC_00508]WUD67124.1 serine/threonine protein phosphatase [Nocardia sp. NBC_00508]
MHTATIPSMRRMETLELGRACWDSASRRGARSINADAVAVETDPMTGATAFVVADGVGDHLLAVKAARTTAAVAARVGVLHGARAGILASQRELRRAVPEPSADSVLVVAVLPGTSRPDGPCEVAWLGDCRAYRWNGRVLHQITTDHTVAELYRARGLVPSPRAGHVVTTSVRTVRPSEIGYAATGSSAGRLLLSTDGVHKPLGIATIKALLAGDDTTATLANTLVDKALRGGGTDNATALVVDVPARTAEERR